MEKIIKEMVTMKSSSANMARLGSGGANAAGSGSAQSGFEKAMQSSGRRMVKECY